jgi:hypothetical protein
MICALRSEVAHDVVDVAAVPGIAEGQQSFNRHRVNEPLKFAAAPLGHHVRSAPTRRKPSSFHPSMPPIIFFIRRPRRASRAAARSAPLQCGPLQ